MSSEAMAIKIHCMNIDPYFRIDQLFLCVFVPMKNLKCQCKCHVYHSKTSN